MATMLDHTETTIQHAPRKFRESRHPAAKARVTVPLALVAEDRPKVQATPTPVALAKVGTDVDSHAALLKLRELVVGPAQQLNEARLEELMKIFEEREAELRALMRDLQKRNSEMEVALTQSSLDQTNALKAQFEALTDSMISESKKALASLRDDISLARKETLSLVQDAKALADQKLEAHAARTNSLVESEAGKLRVELETTNENLITALAMSQRNTQLNISRALKDASENLVRLASAG